MLNLNTFVVMLWFYGGVVVLELDSQPDHTNGQDSRILCMSFIDHNHTSLQTTKPLIARPLSRSPNCVW